MRSLGYCWGLPMTGIFFHLAKPSHRKSQSSSSVQQNAVVLGLEPLHAILLPQFVGRTHLAHLQLAVLHTAARAGQVHVEVHAVDTGARVVLDTQVNVLLTAAGKLSGTVFLVASERYAENSRSPLKAFLSIVNVRLCELTQNFEAFSVFIIRDKPLTSPNHI